MLKSCKYCGRVHGSKYMCPQKAQLKKNRWKKTEDTDARKFRRKNAWKEKSVRIRKRDHFCCLCCKAGLIGTVKKYNTDNLSVHHINSIEEDYGDKLDEDNLITVCDVHHELCEAGTISKDVQRELVARSREGWE